MRYGVRMLVKNPGFTIVAVIALALGIGANSAIFTVVNGVLLRPLPFAEPDRLMNVMLTYPQRDASRASLSLADFLDWKAQNQAFESFAVFGAFGPFNLTGEQGPENVSGVWVTADFFTTLGVQPARGRAFVSGEDQPGSSPVVVISNSLWQRRMGSDPDAVGKSITLNGTSYTVIGIMPAEFRYPEGIELWGALPLTPPTRRGPFWLRGIARLKPDVTLEQARADMQAMAGRIQEQNPNTNDPWTFNIMPMREVIVGDVRPALLVLLGAVAFVLLIATANVANLQLVRAATREKEIAIRRALGASRGRLIRQLLTESVLLAWLGCALGLLLAMWGVDLLIALSPEEIPRLQEARIDTTVLLFTFSISLVSGILFGLVPALQGSTSRLNESLKEGGRSNSEGSARSRMRNLLVVSEFALALMLLIGAGLMIRSFLRLQDVNPGVKTDNILTMHFSLPISKYQGSAQTATFFRELLQRVQALPGVESAATSISLPPNLLLLSDSFTVEGQPIAPGETAPLAPALFVSPDYFRALGVPLLKGRYFTDADTANSPNVTIISDTMARQFFPGEDPLGKRIKLGGPERPNAPWMEVVGVVGDVKYNGLDIASEPVFYRALEQAAFRLNYLVVRTKNDPMTLVPAIRSEVASIDSDLPISRIKTMDQIMSESVAQPRFRTLLLGVFGAVALLLAAVGIYGVMAYTVSQRQREIGIRMALGAQQSDILKMVVRQGVTLALVGTGIGLAGAFAASRFIAKLLFGVSATDLTTFLGIAFLLAVVATAACYIPARRATRVDPMVALRHE